MEKRIKIFNNYSFFFAIKTKISVIIAKNSEIYAMIILAKVLYKKLNWIC